MCLDVSLANGPSVAGRGDTWNTADCKYVSVCKEELLDLFTTSFNFCGTATKHSCRAGHSWLRLSSADVFLFVPFFALYSTQSKHISQFCASSSSLSYYQSSLQQPSAHIDKSAFQKNPFLKVTNLGPLRPPKPTNCPINMPNMGQRSSSNTKFHSYRHVQAPLPQHSAPNDLGDWRRTIGLFNHDEPFSQHHRAGPVPDSSNTPASTRESRLSVPEDHMGSTSDAEDGSGGSGSSTNVGSSGSGANRSMSSMTSIDGDSETTQVDHHHATMKACSSERGGLIGTDKTITYPERLRDSLGQLALESGATYEVRLPHGLVLCDTNNCTDPRRHPLCRYSSTTRNVL